MTMQHSKQAKVLYDSLCHDPFYATLEAAYPDRAGASAAMLRYYVLSIREAERWGRAETLPGSDEGVAVWALPASEEERARKAAEKLSALNDAMGPECTECFARIAANMAVHEEALGLEEYWYLSILGVAPEAQGQGLGARLLAPTLAAADDAGASSYLTTFTPRNIPFYQRLGYVSAGAFPEAITGSDFHVLVRTPRAQ